MNGIAEILAGLRPEFQALLATLFTWGVTALGAAVVFLRREPSQKLLDAMLGFAGGVMLAASYWSLLAPAISMAEAAGDTPWVPAAGGFLLGGFTLRAIDQFLPHLHPGLEEAEGIPTTWRRSILLVLAITLHNIPEGLAIGVAFGAAAIGAPGASLGAAIALAVGIGLQNFPEGTAVALPLRREGMSRGKCFFWGQLSAAVEPVAAMAGVVFVVVAQPILPWALAFAAGAMVFVVIEEVVPEAHRSGNADLTTMSLLIGFTVMMTLDVALG